MSIILFLGKDVNEYNEISNEIIDKKLSEGKILCEKCQAKMKYHLTYIRKIKETGEEINITFVLCTKCKNPRRGDALLPDFVSPYKQYSANEIESVIIDSASHSIKEIETQASEPTVRRWIHQIGERITRAVSILKSIFIEIDQKISEIKLEPGHCYSELEQIIEHGPAEQRYSGNKLGLANIWLSRHNRISYI